jgi:aryl-alcohol dehydrogenase-like predicted oxidoreductase
VIVIRASPLPLAFPVVYTAADFQVLFLARSAPGCWRKRNVERNWRVLDVVEEISQETGNSYPQIALNWLLRQPGVTAPILGARRDEQLEDNLGATGWELTAEQVRRLSEAGAIEDVYPYNMIEGAQRV